MAGDLVLSRGRDVATQEWLSPLLARLAVDLDERPGRRRRDLRLAMPVPARNGSWVVDGWAASRFEQGTTGCRELTVIMAAGRLLHAELATRGISRPTAIDERMDRWALAERVAFGGETSLLAQPLTGRASDFLAQARDQLHDEPERPDLGVEQLVHADLASNVLVDAAGAPVVIDVSPAWRSPVWAEAVAVLDNVLWWDADLEVLTNWVRGRERQAMLHAVLFRALSDDPAAFEPYERVLSLLTD